MNAFDVSMTRWRADASPGVLSQQMTTCSTVPPPPGSRWNDWHDATSNSNVAAIGFIDAR
jgi:hypothetical protein